MTIRLQYMDLSFGGEDFAISCPVGVHPVTAVMPSTIILKRSYYAMCALSHDKKHPEGMLLRDFKY